MEESSKLDVGHLRLVQGTGRELAALLRQKLQMIDEELARLEEEKGRIEHEMTELRGYRAHAAALLSDSTVRSDPRATGSRSIADMVVELLAQLGRALHYREIERELRSRGWHSATGADPASTVLAKYYDDPRLVRVARGTYATKPPGRAQPSVGTRIKRRRAIRSGSGRRLADLVVDLLSDVGRPLHYREIERELRSRALYQAGGADPANTLLANYHNDPRLVRISRGTYALQRRVRPDD